MYQDCRLLPTSKLDILAVQLLFELGHKWVLMSCCFMWMWLYIHALFLDVASANIVRFITETALIDFLFINPYTNSLALHWYIWNGSHSSSVIYPCILMAFVWLPNWYELILFWYNVITTNSIFCHPYYNSSTVTATGRPSFNTLRARQDGRHFPDDIFKRIFLNQMYEFLLRFHWNLFSKGQSKISQHWLR